MWRRRPHSSSSAVASVSRVRRGAAIARLRGGADAHDPQLVVEAVVSQLLALIVLHGLHAICIDGAHAFHWWHLVALLAYALECTLSKSREYLSNLQSLPQAKAKVEAFRAQAPTLNFKATAWHEESRTIQRRDPITGLPGLETRTERVVTHTATAPLSGVAYDDAT